MGRDEEKPHGPLRSTGTGTGGIRGTHLSIPQMDGISLGIYRGDMTFDPSLFLECSIHRFCVPTVLRTNGTRASTAHMGRYVCRREVLPYYRYRFPLQARGKRAHCLSHRLSLCTLANKSSQTPLASSELANKSSRKISNSNAHPNVCAKLANNIGLSTPVAGTQKMPPRL